MSVLYNSFAKKNDTIPKQWQEELIHTVLGDGGLMAPSNKEQPGQFHGRNRKMRWLLVLSSLSLVFAIVGYGSAQILGWPGKVLRLQVDVIRLGPHSDTSSIKIWVANPTLEPVNISVEPSCGCAQITRYDGKIGPLALSTLQITANYQSLLGRPFGRTALEIKCSTPAKRWSEHVTIEATK